jgi:hypothetical protein
VGVGSIAVAAWIARVVFVILLIQALIEERYRVAVVAVGLGFAGWILFDQINPDLVTPYVAILDIGLVFTVLGRDIRLN